MDALIGIREHAALDGEQCKMTRRELADGARRPRVCAVEVIGVAAAPRAVEMLVVGAAEAMDDVESAGPDCDCSGSREGHDAQRLPERGHTKADVSELTLSLLPFVLCRLAAEHSHVETCVGEFVGNLPRYALDAAGARGETFDHECDAQWSVLGPGGSTRVSARGSLVIEEPGFGNRVRRRGVECASWVLWGGRRGFAAERSGRHAGRAHSRSGIGIGSADS